MNGWLRFKNVITSTAEVVCGISVRMNGSLNDCWDREVRKIVEESMVGCISDQSETECNCDKL